MKNGYLTLLLLSLFSLKSYSQGVGIGTSTPDLSAMLDVTATDKGVIIPRIALTGANDNTTIPNPAAGLLLWNTTNGSGLTPGFYYNSGSTSSPVWVKVVDGSSISTYIKNLTGGTGLNSFTYNGSSPVTISLADVLTTPGTFGSATQVPTITVNAKGQITSITNTTIAGVSPSGSAGGDLSGTYPNPQVAQIQGRPVSSSAPSNNDVLTWNGSAWAPSNKAVPSGVIALWNGLQANIPSGWALCDGSNGTPDLRDKFILGANASYDVGTTGGAHSYTLSVTQLPAHTHTGTTSADGGFTPSGSISSVSAGTPSGTISSVSAGTPSGTISSVSAGTPSGSISSTNTDHTHDWGGWWSNDNATDVNNGNGDGTQNTYSDGSRGIYGWNGTWGATVASTASWTGDHTHYLQGRSYGSGWGWPLGVNGGSWGSAGNSNGAGGHNHTTWADIPSHRHYIRRRGTYGMSANASHSHTFSGSALGTHNHTFTGDVLAAHGHTFTGTALGTHSHSFTGNAVSAHTHTFTTSSTGSGSSIDNRPAFYKLAYIMKL